MMTTLILSNEDLWKLVRRVGIDVLMDRLIDRLSEAFANFDEGTTEIPLRTGFYYDTPRSGLIEWMPLFDRHEKVMIKIVGYHPQNPNSLSLPTILSTMSAYETATGHLRALVDGTFLTAMRTGAASAVASRLLALPESKVLGLIGCGAQAVTQLHALSRVFDLREVLLFDADPEVSGSFASRAAIVNGPSIEIRNVEIETVIAQSDVLSVATSVDIGKGPVFQATDTKPWVHINAVGSDLPGKTELPRDLLEACFVCADHPQQASQEGECQQLAAESIGAGLVEVAREPEFYRSVQEQRSVFDSTGWALEDQVAMDLVLEYAKQLGFGKSVAIECSSVDPRNPYDFLNHSAAPIREN